MPHATSAGMAPSARRPSGVSLGTQRLISANELSLVQLGDFCAYVTEAMSTTRGLPIRDAVGWSLPKVGLPRDTSFFASARTYGAAYKPWQKAFEKLFAHRAPLLLKRLRPTASRWILKRCAALGG
jgi:S-DNA-T family DNA segregation ATPase FtsK/SpoIIIE